MTAAAVLVAASGGCSPPAPAPEPRVGREPAAVVSLFADVVRACARPVDATDGIDRGVVAAAGWRVTSHHVTRGGIDSAEPVRPPAKLGTYDLERTEWRRGDAADTMTLVRSGRPPAGDASYGVAQSDTCTADALVRSSGEARTVLAGLARVLHARPQAGAAIFGGGDGLAPHAGKPVGRQHVWYLPAHDVTLSVYDADRMEIEVATPPKNPTARQMFDRSGAAGARL